MPLHAIFEYSNYGLEVQKTKCLKHTIRADNNAEINSKYHNTL